ncbi:MAG: hypothetical protein KC656_07545 [Myxococcales bacterium]|nr:hypothetical protein [Myxococcales bacterium]
MFLLLATGAMAKCSRPAPWHLEMLTEGLQPSTPIYVWSRGEPSGSDRPAIEVVAEHLRLRGPDGRLVAWWASALQDALRFEPVRPLRPGAYRIEQLAEYDDEGWSLPMGAAGEQRWYPVRDFVVAEAVAGSPESQGVTGGAYGVGVLGGAGAHVLELEIEGHGVVAVAPAGATHVGLRTPGCHDTGRRSLGRARARVVAVGVSGQSSPSPWVDISVPGPWDPVDPGPAQWTSVPVSRDTRPAEPPSCALQPIGRPIAHAAPSWETTVLRDSAGALRLIRARAGELELDGQVVPVETAAVPAVDALVGGEDDLVLAVRDPVDGRGWVFRLLGAEVPAERVLDDVAAMRLTGTPDGVALVWEDGAGRSRRELLDARGFEDVRITHHDAEDDGAYALAVDADHWALRRGGGYSEWRFERLPADAVLGYGDGRVEVAGREEGDLYERTYACEPLDRPPESVGSQPTRPPSGIPRVHVIGRPTAPP